MITSENKKYVYLILALLPFAISSLFLFSKSEHQSLFTVMPSWSDEVFYFNQIKSMIKYGNPLGYYGYDGSHAILGNFGTHGWFLLIPYAVFGRIFGLHLNTIPVLNNFFLSIAILIYIYIYRPTIKRTIMFIIGISSPLVIFYANTSLMEGENYFYAIILAVLLSNFEKNTKKIKNILIVVTICAIFCRVTWAIMLFPLTMSLLYGKRCNTIIKWMLAGIVTIVGTVVGYGFFRLCGAAYFQQTYAMNDITVLFKEGVSYHNIRNILENIYDGFTITLGKYDQIWSNHARWYLITTIIISLLFMVFNFRKQKLSYMPFLIVMGGLTGIITFYTSGMQAIRNSYPFAVFSFVYIICSLQNDKKNWIVYSACILFFGSTFLIQSQYGYEYREDWYVVQKTGYYESLEQNMMHISLDEEDVNPWNNTLGVFTNQSPKSVYQLFTPAGLGINYYHEIPESKEDLKPKYCLLMKYDEDAMSKIEEFGYNKICQFYDVVLYEKDKE